MSTSPGGSVYKSPGFAPWGTGRAMKSQLPAKYEEEYQKFLDKCLAQSQSLANAQVNQKPLSATQIMVQQQQAANAQQVAPPSQYWSQPLGGLIQGLGGLIQGGLSGTNYTITTTGASPSWQREYEVSRIVKRAENGYFFVISVDATDNVYYRVWKGGWFPYLVAKAFKRFGEDIDGNRTSWNSVTQRTHLPATLGSAYEKIDAAIKGDMEDRDHDSYIKEMLKTKPENLKMIGNLEKLAEGDVDAKDDDPSINSGSSNATSNWVSGVQQLPPGNMIPFTTSSANYGNLVGVATMEADKIVLNGVDIAAELADLKEELRHGVEAQEEAPTP